MIRTSPHQARDAGHHEPLCRFGSQAQCSPLHRVYSGWEGGVEGHRQTQQTILSSRRFPIPHFSSFFPPLKVILIKYSRANTTIRRIFPFIKVTFLCMRSGWGTRTGFGGRALARRYRDTGLAENVISLGNI